MNFTGLSLDQAPPLHIPLRYFIVAPLFAVLSACVIFFGGFETLSRFNPTTIAAVHLITIGFFGFVMLGALTQMLPVIANATIKKVDYVATLGHLLLSVGVVSMLAGLTTLNHTFLTIAYLGLGSGFFLMIVSILNAITTVSNVTPTIKAMFNSMSFAFIIVVLGVFLLFEYTSDTLSSLHLQVANIHAALAIFGFAGLLIVGVVFQVLPMFYVASSFGSFFEEKFLYLVGSILVAWAVVNFFAPEYLLFVKLVIVACFLAFGIALWKKLQTRKRKVNDITIFYFKSSIVFLALGLILWLFTTDSDEKILVMSAVFIGGFILSVMQGMLYKIIPFLVWFHLNAKGYMSIPTMNEMIDKRASQVQFILFLLGVILFTVSFLVPSLFSISLILFVVSMLLLEYNIITAYKVYHTTMKKKPDFDMSSFQ